ncbi:hypothetical protein SAMN05216207_1008170 [Pseudonocardia ammonioxydans]|uniref:Uncharacterized protein n=1 Tax=Pseudonocardia ammonioxydans TaxID=260086 RepID=A0A1I4WK49_PSUAM|nr:hypothetical protein [Pseudonocardia ammonioxydans]SFN13606.1 hypothetical protein SAMN05216207_1008170 [Pseudonocardia ammonioxydans]
MVWDGVGTLLLAGGLIAGVVWIAVAAAVGTVPRPVIGVALWVLVPLAWLGSLGVVLVGGSVGTGWAVLLGLLAVAVVACLLGRRRVSRQT